MRLSYSWQWISPQHCQRSLRIHLTIASWIHSYFNNDVMKKFMINNGQMHEKLTSICWMENCMFVRKYHKGFEKRAALPPPSFSENPRGYFPNSCLWSKSPLKDWLRKWWFIIRALQLHYILFAEHHSLLYYWLFSGTVEKEANGNDTFCFLNFEFI